jgi:hypothetical protein
MSDDKKISHKVRVCRRKDGATFIYTDRLAARNDMRVGTKIIYTDGSSAFQPERLAPSAPEPDLLEEAEDKPVAKKVKPPKKLKGVDLEVEDLTPNSTEDL